MIYPHLDSIKDGFCFQDLVKAYFDNLKKPGSDIIGIKTTLSGTGADKGKDLIVEITLYDQVSTHIVRWVVQCKFLSRSVGMSHLADVNIANLLRYFNANGYLLICKTRPTELLRQHFEDLNTNCRDRYKYEIWTGADLMQKLKTAPAEVLAPFFPRYYKTITSKQKKTKK